MPTFYFKMDDDSPDAEGYDLESVAVAKCEAAKMLGWMLCDDSQRFWHQAAWTMTVSDEKGLTLFQLDVVGTEAAAIRGRRPVRQDAALAIVGNESSQRP
jgi:hypothetical protein